MDLSFLIVSNLAPPFAWRQLFSSDKRLERLYFIPWGEEWLISLLWERKTIAQVSYHSKTIIATQMVAPNYSRLESLNPFTFRLMILWGGKETTTIISPRISFYFQSKDHILSVIQILFPIYIFSNIRCIFPML